MNCPLCEQADLLLFHEDKKRTYMQCCHCSLVFIPSRYRLSAEAEKAEYDLHNNSPKDQGYRKFLSRLANPLLERLSPDKVGLDFGCGPGPTLSVMMEEAGHSVQLFDYFYFPDKSALENKYDFITSTEVVEHLHNPGEVFLSLFNMLKPKAYLGLMTKLVKDHNSFKTWHYIQDQTHICFFSKKTFQYIAEKYSAKLEFIGNDVILFQK